MGNVLDRLSDEERRKISELFANKAAALPMHNAQVKAEVGNPTHSFTRHGYQTGWESQLLRLVTGRTPDQPEDEEGSKDAVDKYRAKEALPIQKRGAITYAKADSVGAFLSPEVEAFAVNRARAKAAPLLDKSWAETATKAKTDWVEYDYIDMIVSGPHALAGVSFTRAKHAKKLTEGDAVQAIEDFIHSARTGPEGSTQTWEDKKNILSIMEDADVAAPYTRSAYRKDYKLRFTSMSDLLAYLDVTARWMRNVNVVLRKFGNHDWRIHTAYCVDCTEQRSPTRGGPTVKTGKWTGNLRATKDGAISFVDPKTLA